MGKYKLIAIGFFGPILLFVVGIAALLAYMYSDVLIEEFSAIEVKQLSRKNSTTYLFDGSLESIRKKIIDGIKMPEFDSPFPFKVGADVGGVRPNVHFYICEATGDHCLSSNKTQVDEIFKRPDNANDVYLASDGTRMASRIYFAVGKPLEFRSDFHIHFEPVNAGQTRATIIPINPTVYKGYGGLGLHGGVLKKQIPVDPTTVEEYELLRYIGHVLGNNNMPDVVYPN